MGADIFFVILSALTLASAVMVVAFKSPIHSALSLVLCLVSVAGHFALLGAHFLAMIQIALYAGAIVVLVLFVIMLLNVAEPLKLEVRYITWSVSILVLAVTLFVALSKISILPETTVLSKVDGSAESLGMRLFTDYIWQFEFASLLILAAVVGVVMIAGKVETPEDMISEGAVNDLREKKDDNSQEGK